MTTPVKGVEAGTGAAGLPIRPYRRRCNFGQGHTWVMERLNGRDEAPCQCSRCGAVSSDHPSEQKRKGDEEE